MDAMNSFPGRFLGRKAVITGGASGLGLRAGQRIVDEGGQVSLWDSNASALQEARNAIPDVHTVCVNVGNHQAVAEAARQSRSALGKIDILINCAGITGATVPIRDFPVQGWLEVMDVNLNGLFYCCREITPLMSAQGYGRVVNISSVAGKEGNP